MLGATIIIICLTGLIVFLLGCQRESDRQIKNLREEKEALRYRASKINADFFNLQRKNDSLMLDHVKLRHGIMTDKYSSLSELKSKIQEVEQ